MGDVNGDGVEEIVTVPAAGGPQVRIFSLEGELQNQFFAYDNSMTAGLFVSVGEVFVSPLET